MIQKSILLPKNWNCLQFDLLVVRYHCVDVVEKIEIEFAEKKLLVVVDVDFVVGYSHDNYLYYLSL